MISTNEPQEDSLPIANNPLLNEAVAIILQEKGRIAILELSRRLRVNYKWLERNFTATHGFTPKVFANQQRYLAAYVELMAATQPDLLTIATNNGYYDQNHLIKDFKRYTGSTPLRLWHSLRTYR